ncbi:MAG: hypothetical protein DRP63_03535 [Planctomycetota bacterium]|nr:MAG: hypothetical protein DRP63_03535 [Planctomycetota bacterium]
MRCDEAQKLLAAFITGELRDEALSALREHASHCEECRARFEEAQALESALKRAYALQVPPTEPVMRRVMRLQRRRRWHRLLFVAFVLVLLVVALVAGIVVLRAYPLALAQKEVRLLVDGAARLMSQGEPQQCAAIVARSSPAASKKRLRRNAYLDPWGTPYRLYYAGGRWRAVSAGPDRKFGTPDDITAEGR